MVDKRVLETKGRMALIWINPRNLDVRYWSQLVSSGTFGRVNTVEQTLRALLQEQTASGILGPGGKLATERDLAGQLTAPRSEIRRALASLERDGLITRHVGRGTFLTEAATRHFNGAPPDTSPAEIMQTRLTIEPPIAALAARTANQADLDRITAFLDAGGRSDSYEVFETHDTHLHRAIAQAVHNGLLMNLFDVMSTARSLPVWGSLKRRTSTPERRRAYHDQHTAIVAALTERDPEHAETVMRDHLRNVSDDMLGRH
jgi:DNA-binding FadR family transcriptional regulator